PELDHRRRRHGPRHDPRRLRAVLSLSGRDRPWSDVWLLERPRMKLQLTLACGDYDRTRALRWGLVEPEGIDLNYLCMPVEETFWRTARFREFEVAEMSMGSYLIRRAKGIEDLIAIPIFPSRMFRHAFYFVNAAAEIRAPQDLKGRRMSVPEYQIT